jgi:hypothetical protein
MSALYFDQFSDEAELVQPYQAIGDDVVLAYDRDALSMGTMASVRNLVDEAGVRFLAIDGLNFEEQWFGLEFDLGDNFKSAKISLKTYPARQIYPKVYFDGGSMDLNTLEIGEEVIELNFSALHMTQSGLLKGAKNLRLSLMVPSRDWFVVGLYGAKITHA